MTKYVQWSTYEMSVQKVKFKSAIVPFYTLSLSIKKGDFCMY